MEMPADDRAILEQVDRILHDSRFARAPVLSRLLKYIVEETLAPWWRTRGDLHLRRQ